MLSVLKWNGWCINSLATNSKIKIRAAWDLETKDFLQPDGGFPTEDEREGRNANNGD